MAGAIALRRAGPDDAQAIADLYAPYVSDTAITFETEAPDAETMATRISDCLKADMPWLVALEGERLLGYAYAHAFHPRAAYRFTVEPSVYIARAAHGAGLGSRLYGALLDIVTELGYRQAVALVTLPNPASEALHKRFGFYASGGFDRSGYKFDQWIDVGLFQKALGPGGDVPPTGEPAQLGSSALWRALGEGVPE